MLKFDKVPPICRVFFHGKVHFSHAGSSVKTLNVLQRLGGHLNIAVHRSLQKHASSIVMY